MIMIVEQEAGIGIGIDINLVLRLASNVCLMVFRPNIENGFGGFKTHWHCDGVVMVATVVLVMITMTMTAVVAAMLKMPTLTERSSNRLTKQHTHIYINIDTHIDVPPMPKLRECVTHTASALFVCALASLSVVHVARQCICTDCKCQKKNDWRQTRGARE